MREKEERLTGTSPFKPDLDPDTIEEMIDGCTRYINGEKISLIILLIYPILCKFHVVCFCI